MELMLSLCVHLLTYMASAQEEEERDWTTCSDRCDESYFPGRPCYCNDLCTQYENCCYDVIELCLPELATDDSWRNFSGHAYKYFKNGGVSAREASSECFREGALLVAINSQHEYDFITGQVLRSRTLSAFIGGSDRDNEGSWLWSDGTPMAMPSEPWHAWFPGEPNNAGSGQDCSTITNYMFWSIRKRILESYAWLDYSCDYNPAGEIQGFICEKTLLCEEVECLNGGRCVYIPGPEQFECVCPSPYVGHRCQYEEKKDVIWTICGETRLTEAQGIIESPLYPKNYPANVRCLWHISVPSERTLSLSLADFRLEDSKDCMLDGLTIYDGAGTNSSVLTGPLCGQLASLGDVAQTTLVTSSSEAVVEFRTDKNVAYRGFSLSYSEALCGQGTGDSGCGVPSTYTSQCGDIHFLHAPPDGVTACFVTITVEPNKRINLKIVEFKTIDTGPNCENGSVTVRDGIEAGASVLRVLCGWWAEESILSSSNTMSLTLNTLPLPSAATVHFTYSSIEESETGSHQPIVLTAASGSLTLNENTVIYSEDEGVSVYQWLIVVPYGNYIQVQWTPPNQTAYTLEIFAGHNTDTDLLFSSENINETINHIEIHYFQALLQITRVTGSSFVEFQADFESKEWEQDQSGCFRPYYRSDVTSKHTENSRVSSLNAVMLMASQQSYDTSHPGYEAGLYCTWHIQAASGTENMTVEFIDVNIHPKTAGCLSDGVVILHGDDVIGPFCGAESVESKTLHIASEAFSVVFYSGSGSGFRESGILRALITADSTDSTEACPVWRMGERRTQRVSAECGVVLSPRLPGLVGPGLWFWVFTAPDDPLLYYSVYVYYVRGPAVEDDSCQQYFKVIEISRDAKELRQHEADLVTLCGTTDLFQPATQIRLPPKQQLGLELKTSSNSLPLRWEFKVAFRTERLETPREYPETGGCPDEYMEWRGFCYRYYPWILRHYEAEKYLFQTTWQRALRQCEQENATLLSIYDDEEAHFIKVQLASTWFWHGAAPFAINHRLVFLGLSNRQQSYRWTSDVALGYSEWYTPREGWEQVLISDDSEDVPRIVNSDLRQPTADSANLCAAFLSTSPHGSLNWVKLPCDYPLFRAGLICKQPVDGAYGNGSSDRWANESVTIPQDNNIPRMHNQQTYSGCMKGWFLLARNCFAVYSKYSYTNSSDDLITDLLSLNESLAACQDMEGRLPDMDEVDTRSASRLQRLMRIWNHTEHVGNILIGSDETRCAILHVDRLDEFDGEVTMDIRVWDCVDDEFTYSSTLCVTEPYEHVEECGEHEFRCANGMCILADYVCDSQDDCRDNSDEHGCECDQSSFQCSNGDCVSISFRCDFIEHCSDGSDEERCVHGSCRSDEFRCDNDQCIAKSETCNRRFDCVDGSDESTQLCAGVCDGFQCYSGVCLDASLMQDGMTDCPGLAAEDEADQAEALDRLHSSYYGNTEANKTTIYGCKEGGTYTTCHHGQSPCYDRADMCVYDTDIRNEALGQSVQTICRDGANLAKICGELECPGMHHCRHSYCIPRRKVCDAVLDCPEGDDEADCHRHVCPGLFHCKDSDVCIPHSEVCDGVKNCPAHGEDEKHCHAPDILCEACVCHGHIAYCEDANITLLPTAQNTHIRLLRAVFLSRNNIAQLPASAFHHLAWLTRLLLSHNKISELRSNIFAHLENLLDLDLSFNMISSIHSRTFQHLKRLKTLNLNNNNLETVRASQLRWLTTTERLMIDGNHLDNVDKGTFDEMTELRTLNAHAYKICCVATNVDECTPEADEFSSCEDLMANSVLQVSIWILGFVSLFGNAFVVIWRVNTDRKKSSSFFIINLGCSDFLMGVYLIIIASVDAHYRGNYIVHADWWRGSALCELAGVLATLSSETSVFMLTTITVERFFTLVFPLRFGQLRLKYARYVAAAGWTLCFCLSVLPLSQAPLFGDSFYGRTGVCLPFIVSSRRSTGWEYSAFLFLGLNLFSFLIIFIGYTAIFVHVKASIDAVSERATGTADEYALAKKLALIVGTDFMCWVPIILIGIAALGGAYIPPEVSAWIAVFVLPLNSAVNPLLYTISALDCGKATKKKKGGVEKGPRRESRREKKAVSREEGSSSVHTASTGTTTGSLENPDIIKV